MSVEIDKSIKLVYNEFQKSIAEVPLEVYYQTISADQYTANGFQFNIKQPGPQALLDSDIWIRYKIKILETANNALVNSFENPTLNVAANANATRAYYPATNTRFAFRGGNIMQRAIAQFSVQINNRTISVQPYRWIDALNRLYISNDQSEHEFSASGGRFDEGNHGVRTSKINWKDRTSIVNDNVQFFGPTVPTLWASVINALIASDNSTAVINVNESYYTNTNPVLTGLISADQKAQRNFGFSNLKPDFPLNYEFYNPGFDARVNKLTELLRRNRAEYYGVGDFNSAYLANAAPVATAATVVTPLQFRGSLGADAGGAHEFIFEIFERLPCPLFKMYSNDEVYGVIPNITQMQLQGNFLNTFLANILRSDNEALAASISFDNLGGSDCQLYLRWFSPPQQMSIPREITIPYKKINVWPKTYPLTTAPNAMAGNASQSIDVSEYNITLEAIPDLLLIYLKYNASAQTLGVPDDYNAEITDLTINIDNASGKLNQIQSIDLYNKWKKLLKHNDNRIIGYNEWRKYCCVAALQPEDYGVRYGPGYSNQTALGIKFKGILWNVNPSIMYQAVEYMPNNATTANALELEVVSIFNRNALTIRADGSASEELLKVAADFNMSGLTGQMQTQAPMEMRSRLTM